MVHDELFKTAFGVSEYASSQDPRELDRLSYLGTPVLFPIKFKHGNYNIYNRVSDIEQKAYSDFMLPFSTLVTLRRAKIFKETKTVGSKGTVKETYGFSDWSIEMRGVCLNNPNHATAKTAFDQHRILVEWEKIVDAISIEGALFSAKGIRNIVIKEISFGQLEGQPNKIPFTIRAVSDEPLELILP
ncbi:DUF6046 domain-containing protein [Tenacibaculum maritimum]|uniref:DUF6046 domain-containing protein n=1 Tax=Tenacibaculum maritimum TaxID=107401 RepID=UPI0012E3FFD3|nr:DUF6046 domain-containing protein [Tenacibaculum maritimum]CAA0228625.1 conserved hypothetical protein [Tenacibaculum maritimum]CAA0239153.1 conserved hypothetical protein [Tenacibaculum maritimum]CAA0249230.1 conserved hypothetical protein [Tenacibaculum maritimum]